MGAVPDIVFISKGVYGVHLLGECFLPVVVVYFDLEFFSKWGFGTPLGQGVSEVVTVNIYM